VGAGPVGADGPAARPPEAAKGPPAGVLIKVGSLLDEGMRETARGSRAPRED
jgi:hypothetical protein